MQTELQDKRPAEPREPVQRFPAVTDAALPREKGSGPRPLRIVVLGGGFGGVTAVRHLERLCRKHVDLEITLLSRENYFVLTPLLFEACSGRLELRHCAQPIRPALRRARFVEAAVEQVDTERRIVR
ncbi:MAG TPA: hypothetical protein VEB59_16545, partial [Gemmatimonadales bacterium]|nr:hypothetical protein [Gemmatimonadales bacterium]